MADVNTDTPAAASRQLRRLAARSTKTRWPHPGTPAVRTQTGASTARSRARYLTPQVVAIDSNDGLLA